MSTGLRPYQEDANAAVMAQYAKGQNRLLIKLPTGTGKTRTTAAFFGRADVNIWKSTLPKAAQRVLWIAHREELLEQALETIQHLNPGILASIEQADRHANVNSDVVVASIQSLAGREPKPFHRLKRLLRHGHFGIVVIDEAHHAAAPSYRNALVHLGFLPKDDLSEGDDIEAASFDDVAKMEAALAGWDAIAPKDRLLIGLTATPNRSDAIGLGCVIQSIAYSYGLKDAINDGWLTPIRPIVVESGESLDNVKTTAGDFNQKDLAAAVNTERRTQLAVAAWLEHAKNRPTLAFTVDVAHALAVAYAFRQAGVAAMPISGLTPKDERRELLRRFKAGEVQMLCNAMLLTEGTDLPPTSCILHLKPTKSATLYEQMTGRGLRLSPGTGKTDCIVIDLVDIAKRHSLQACPVLYGLPPGIKTTGQDLRSTETDFEALRAKYPHLDIESAINGGRMTLAELGAKVATFDVWTVPTLGEIAKETTQNWLKIGESYRLQYPWQDGSEVLTVLRDLIGKWDVSCTFRPKDGPVRQRTLVSALETSVAAIKHADQFVSTQRSVASRLTDKNAKWRKGPASEAQMGLLTRYRVPYNRKELLGPGGKGKASDLIGMAKARGGR